MTERYRVIYNGAKSRIIETPAGEWPQFNSARVAAIGHVEEVLAEAQATLDVLRRCGNFHGYTLRRVTAGGEQESHDVRLVIHEDAEDSFKKPSPFCRRV